LLAQVQREVVKLTLTAGMPERPKFDSDLLKVLQRLIRKYWSEKPMVLLLAIGALGLRGLSKQMMQLRKPQSLGMHKTQAGLAAGAQGRDSKSDPKSKSSASGPEASAKQVKKKPVVRVDGVFFNRIKKLMPLMVPHWRSKESLLLVTQSSVLLGRSLLSIHITKLIGEGLQAVMERSTYLFCVTLGDFFISGVLASLANSALKYLDNLMSTWFRENLTREVHSKYMHAENYYRAAVLMQSSGSETRLDNLDQRIVSDLSGFTKQLANLYSRTFKPFLDVILTTTTMAQSLGYKGPLLMYGYFICSSAFLRAFSPPLARLTAQQQAIEGDFRHCHSRVLAHAEEVAFVGGAAREEEILNKQLVKVSANTEYCSLKQFEQGVLDQFGLKYFASCIGWPVIALPFILQEEAPANLVEWIARYRVSDDLIRQGSAAFGELLVVYKKLQTLAGFTSRVAELIEALDQMKLPPSAAPALQNPTNALSNAFQASGATIDTPDGRNLVCGLTFSMDKGEHLLITGPNGAGKTSLFRALAGLWPCKAGEVHGLRPLSRDVLYMPQMPYLVWGSLREQVIYPCTPLQAASVKGGQDAMDKSIKEALELAGMERFTAEGLDLTYTEWDDVLSGGEKQRMGWARLFFHSPGFAALDEATSAINVQQEEPLYQAALDRNITLISIAHRPTVRKFHRWELNVTGDGNGSWTLTKIED